jgi:hypothetical protein
VLVGRGFSRDIKTRRKMGFSHWPSLELYGRGKFKSASLERCIHNARKSIAF